MGPILTLGESTLSETALPWSTKGPGAEADTASEDVPGPPCSQGWGLFLRSLGMEGITVRSFSLHTPRGRVSSPCISSSVTQRRGQHWYQRVVVG